MLHATEFCLQSAFDPEEGEMTTAQHDFQQAIARLHAAMAKVVTGDVSLIKALHSHADDVTSFYGMGGYEKGWEAVSKRWDWAGTQFHGGTVSYENLSSGVSGDLGYTVDIENQHLTGHGDAAPMQRSVRVTHVFRREDGEWRLVHRHGNRLEKGPSGS
jgi:ketosteroid isomerase-like protein